MSTDETMIYDSDVNSDGEPTVAETDECEGDLIEAETDSSDGSQTEELDIDELALICPDITEENADAYCNLARYRELRALGLSGEEAYAATAKKRVARDSRAHLSSSIGRGASMPRSGMPEQDLRAAREIFIGMSDAEIRQLYKKVI